MSGLWASGSSRRRSVGDSTKNRRPRLKALAAESAQERRRQEFISAQKRVRADVLSCVQQLYVSAQQHTANRVDSRLLYTGELRRARECSRRCSGRRVEKCHRSHSGCSFSRQCRPLLKQEEAITMYSSSSTAVPGWYQEMIHCSTTLLNHTQHFHLANVAYQHTRKRHANLQPQLNVCWELSEHRGRLQPDIRVVVRY